MRNSPGAEGGAGDGRATDADSDSGASIHGVSAARLLQDWRAAHTAALDYLAALGAGDDAGCARVARAAVERALSRADWEPAADAIGETLRAVRELVVEGDPPPPTPGYEADPFLVWRLLNGVGLDLAGEPGGGLLRDGALRSGPGIVRGAMVPERIERGLRARLRARFGRRPGAADTDATSAPRRAQRRGLDWVPVARRRRALLGLLVLVPSVIASGFMVNVLPGKGDSWLEVAIVLLFGALFGWISIGFWTALFGFFLLLGKRDRFAITSFAAADPTRAVRELAPGARTAVVMPICEEPVERVFAGLRAVHASLARLDALDRFHFFVLSDSSNPGTGAREEEAWARWCRDVGGFGRIFYRRRKVRLERKAGNVADFCRRWGRRYEHMIMLDADSVMTGESLVQLVRMMEANPDVGLIQTVPTAVNRRSLLARVQQFTTRVYGPMFCAGLHFWQLGEGQYWGHNAILRVAPFMRHCALPRLPGRPPLGGEILSHDFVEAALLGRAGWTLWLAYDLPGSFEEVPSTLLEEMGRDRRWCQGNLQHARLLFSEGLFGAHRALFVNGVLSYVSALLWFAFLLLSTAAAIRDAIVEPDYFPSGRSLFPEWPVWRPDWAMWLLAVTGVILFLPKILGIGLIVWKRRDGRSYGGAARLAASAFLEVALSTLLAPIRMVFHSRFVLTNLMGRTVTWRSQGRDDVETGWREAFRQHGFDTIFATAWAGLLLWLNPGYFWWVTPIIGALLVSIPFSVWTSRVTLGDRARARGLFLIPEETAPPRELCDLDAFADAEEAASAALAPAARADGFVRAAVDPALNALRTALAGPPRRLRPGIRAHRAALVDLAIDRGPAALSPRERRILLADPESVAALHRRVWAAPAPRSAAWRAPRT